MAVCILSHIGPLRTFFFNQVVKLFRSLNYWVVVYYNHKLWAPNNYLICNSFIVLICLPSKVLLRAPKKGVNTVQTFFLPLSIKKSGTSAFCTKESNGGGCSYFPSVNFVLRNKTEWVVVGDRLWVNRKRRGMEVSNGWYMECLEGWGFSQRKEPGC